MVVAGGGGDHDTLVEAAQRHFVDQRPVWETEEGGLVEVQTDRSIAQYTGGIVSREKDLSDVSLGPTPMPELGHIVIGLFPQKKLGVKVHLMQQVLKVLVTSTQTSSPSVCST